VGDDSSHLYKYTGVFNGTTISGPTSVTLNATAEHVSSPVYDSGSGCVFVGDTAGNIYSVNSGVPGSVCGSSSFGTVVAAANLGGSTTSNTDGAYDGPIVDSSANESISSSMTWPHKPAAARFITTMRGPVHHHHHQWTGAHASEGLGGGQDSYSLYAGSFDNVYYEGQLPRAALCGGKHQ